MAHVKQSVAETYAFVNQKWVDNKFTIYHEFILKQRKSWSLGLNILRVFHIKEQ